MLEAVLEAVGRGSGSLPDRPLTAFDTLVGKRWNGELLLVGRAVNGWHDKWKPEEANDPSRRSQIVASLREAAARGRECPMTWVTDFWSSGKEYNTARSAFWRVAKAVTADLGLTKDAGEWPSHLVWTNLYRVAPSEGGNPSSRLRKVQEEACIDSLGEDIDRRKPVRILFLTGYDWAQPFLGRLGRWRIVRDDVAGIAAAGRLERGGRSIRIVVASHPQGKPEASMVKGIAGGWEMA